MSNDQLRAAGIRFFVKQHQLTGRRVKIILGSAALADDAGEELSVGRAVTESVSLFPMVEFAAEKSAFPGSTK
jgi:hypothetical protein